MLYKRLSFTVVLPYGPAVPSRSRARILVGKLLLRGALGPIVAVLQLIAK